MGPKYRVKETAGPSTTLRSGRDDNSVAGGKYFPAEAVIAATLAVTTDLSSRPERSVVEGPAVSFGQCAFFISSPSH